MVYNYGDIQQPSKGVPTCRSFPNELVPLWSHQHFSWRTKHGRSSTYITIRSMKIALVNLVAPSTTLCYVRYYAQPILLHLFWSKKQKKKWWYLQCCAGSTPWKSMTDMNRLLIVKWLFQCYSHKPQVGTVTDNDFGGASFALAVSRSFSLLTRFFTQGLFISKSSPERILSLYQFQSVHFVRLYHV